MSTGKGYKVMNGQVKLPIGIDSFEKIRNAGAYYVDKTGFLSQLLFIEGEVSLFTRPRRFGKTLTMTMLRSFFDITRQSKELFEGLKISEYPDICAEWMNQYPVIFLTLKAVEGNDFETAYANLQGVISEACGKHLYLRKSQSVDPRDLDVFARLYDKMVAFSDFKDLGVEERKKAIKEELTSSLLLLSKMLFDHWKKPAIIIIDEYDVPLAKADRYGYYDQMIEVIRALMNKTLKSNDYLKKAFMTGCLRVTKESIFTGLNNPFINTISETNFSEFIGFTQAEVDQLLKDTHLTDHAESIKQWYDGYLFGESEMYCPWDMMNHIQRLQNNPRTIPQNHWGNTSSNDVLAKFFEQGASDDANEKFETLLSGGSICVKVREELTYDSLLYHGDNFWSLLYMTGYLTKADKEPAIDKIMNLRIPNAEIQSLFKDAIIDRFDYTVRTTDLSALFNAFWKGDVAIALQETEKLLRSTISYYDSREDFYHAFITGLFSGAGFVVKSNRESGEGRPDIVVKSNSKRSAIIIEIKKSEKRLQMEADCDAALQQIVEKNYTSELEDEYPNLLCYGISFFKKSCLIKKLE